MAEIIIAVAMFLFAILAIRGFVKLITDATFKSLIIAKTEIAGLKRELAAEKKQSKLVSVAYLELSSRVKEIAANRDRWIVAYESLKIYKSNSGTTMSVQTWRRLAKLTHPDKHNNSKEAEEVMKLLLEMKPNGKV